MALLFQGLNKASGRRKKVKQRFTFGSHIMSTGELSFTNVCLHKTNLPVLIPPHLMNERVEVPGCMVGGELKN